MIVLTEQNERVAICFECNRPIHPTTHMPNGTQQELGLFEIVDDTYHVCAECKPKVAERRSQRASDADGKVEFSAVRRSTDAYMDKIIHGDGGPEPRGIFLKSEPTSEDFRRAIDESRPTDAKD